MNRGPDEVLPMNRAAPTQPTPSASALESSIAPVPPPARVRPARHADAPAVAAAVRELLFELGATPPSLGAMETAARTLIDDRGAGVVLVAAADEQIVGVLAASMQTAVHAAGPYALIQELWVDRLWRRRAIGAELISALCELARMAQLAHVEVGLPREGFAWIRATEAFYLSSGFQPLGVRMRRSLV